jgi:hypothetical protein
MRYLLACLALLAHPLFAQERHTEHTLKLGAGQNAQSARVDDMSFLAGRWVGEGMGGQSEEQWGPVYLGRMLGTFTHSEQGAPIFHELMVVMEVEGRLVVRLKHFNPDLTGWEEKDRFVDFHYVAMRGKDGVLTEEAFRLKRAH